MNDKVTGQSVGVAVPGHPRARANVEAQPVRPSQTVLNQNREYLARKPTRAWRAPTEGRPDTQA